MTLSDTQKKFARMSAELILKAIEMGYAVTLGDAFRDPRLHGSVGTKLGYGKADSCHKLRLAIDLNLFKDGKFLMDTADHEPLGVWWESQGGSWGGRFHDGNHYSLAWGNSK